jgi:hypothetical protein
VSSYRGPDTSKTGLLESDLLGGLRLVLLEEPKHCAQATVSRRMPGVVGRSTPSGSGTSRDRKEVMCMYLRV